MTCMTPSYVMRKSAIIMMAPMTRMTIASFLYFFTTQSTTLWPRKVATTPQDAKRMA